MEFFLPTPWDDGWLYDAVLPQRPHGAGCSPGLPCPMAGGWLPLWGSGCASHVLPKSGRAQLVTCSAVVATLSLPGSRAELSSACVHMPGSLARAGSPSSSSSLVPELAGEPASKQNSPLLSLSSEAACLSRWLSVAVKPAWEWAPLPHSSWVDSH